MSEYKGIKGFQVQTRTEDPSPSDVQIVGDFYYNSSTVFKTLKHQVEHQLVLGQVVELKY